jgi:hypothetical protein
MHVGLYRPHHSFPNHLTSGSRTLAAGQLSDHLLLVAGFNAWHSAPNKKEASRLAKQHFLDVQV